MKDTHEKFSKPTVLLHWIIAFPFIAMLVIGLILDEMENGPNKFELIGTHKSIGILILVLAIVRILWRMKNKFPKPLSEIPNWQKRLAQAAHWVLIIGTVMMPISGITMSIGGGHSVGLFGMELIAGTGVENGIMDKAGHIMHGLGSKLIILFLVLHIVGAFKHQFMDKDGTLSRVFGRNVTKA